LKSFWLISIILLLGCNQDKTKSREESKTSEVIAETIIVPPVSDVNNEAILAVDYDTSSWSELRAEDHFLLDLRYATTDNFTDTQIYPCGRCFLRPAIAAKLKTINNKIKLEKGYTLKLYDCYRPRPAQQKLWDIVPNPTYVTKPEKGSMHNRGAAVDLTIIDKNGQELDMGTDFDHFGREARHAYDLLPDQVLANRKFLRELMEDNGFKAITSEWWHYSFSGPGAPLSDWQWPCL